jgi:hypothetical protein
MGDGMKMFFLGVGEVLIGFGTYCTMPSLTITQLPDDEDTKAPGALWQGEPIENTQYYEDSTAIVFTTKDSVDRLIRDLEAFKDTEHFAKLKD